MIIEAKVHPGAKKNLIEKNKDGSLEIWVTLPPVKNLANKAVVEALAAHFKVAKSQIELIRGFTSRYKTFEIQDNR